MLYKSRTFALLIMSLLLAACATGPRYSELKSSIPPLAPDQGRIYFYRTTGMFGAAIQPSIALNGASVGTSRPRGFFYIDRAPGSYEVSCTTEVTRKVTFQLEAGQEQYIKMSLGMGVFVGHVIPELVDPEKARKEVENLHYVKPDPGAK
jgi:hypothetical protein